MGGIGNEAEIVNEEKDDDVDVEVSGGKVEVPEIALERADKVSNVEAPEEGGEEGRPWRRNYDSCQFVCGTFRRRPPSVRTLRISTTESRGL